MPSRQPDIPALAVSYRRLVFWVGIQLLAYIASGAIGAFEPTGALATLVSLLFTVAILASIIMVLITAYKTAKALGSSVPVLWVVAMFIPLLNVIFLLVLSSKATALCRAHGVPVGFLGPKLPVAVPIQPLPPS